MAPRRAPPRLGVGIAVAVVAVLLGSGLLVTVTGTARASPGLTWEDDPALAPFATRAGYLASLAAGATDVVPLTGSVEVVVTFESPNASFYDPVDTGAPAMTEAQVGAAYGLSASAYGAAEQYFESRGLSVLHAWPNRLSLSLTGTAAAVGAAFGTTLLQGVYEGRAVSYPGSAPSLPAPLAGEVAAVSGLGTGLTAFSLPYLPAASPRAAAVGPDQNPANLVTPTDARDIYDVSGLYNLTASPTYATGKGIVLLLWGWGYDPSDLSTFFADDYPTEFPTPTVVPYPIDSAPSPGPSAVNDPSNGSREMTLDIEWSGSMAPGATLDAVYAPPGPAADGYSPTDAAMEDAIDTAVDPHDVPNVAVISMSFGSADGQDPSYQIAFESAFQTATDEHISLFAATGDTGGDAPSSGGGCSGTAQPEYPAASTQVVAVGGTSVTLDRSVLGSISGFNETGWSESGGGYSVDYKAPSWQLVGSAAAPIEAGGGYRGMPDVAATAAYNFLYFDGQMLAGAGTSFASPLWAGTVAEMDALHGSNFGFLTPALYSIATGTTSGHPSFHDITSGANCVATAGPGWDAVTGWGSPDATNLYEHLVASFVDLSIGASPTLIAPGGSVSITAVVTNASSGAAIASLPVVVSLDSTGLGGPCSGTFGSSTVRSNDSGSVAASFSVQACYLGSSAVANVVVESDGYYGSAATTISVNLLGFAPWLAPLAQYPTSIVLYAAIMAVAIVVGAALGLPPAPPVMPPAAVAPPAPPAPAPPPESPGPPPDDAAAPAAADPAPPEPDPPDAPET